MKNPLAFFLDTLRPGGALHAAAREGEATSITWLLSNNVFAVDCYYDGKTALYIAVQSNQHACILALLKNKANPNLPSLNTYLKKQEKLIQICINSADLSGIKLLIMHGANNDGVLFIENRQDVKTLFYKTLETKQQYDTFLKEAKAQLLNKQYSHALTNYLQTGNIWSNLSQDEPVVLYQNYYQEQSLIFYRKAIDCYKMLSAMDFTQELKADCQQLFERAADCCQLLKLADEAKIYSSQFAALQPGLRRQAYSCYLKAPQPIAYNEVGLYQRKVGKQEEEQPLLLDVSYTPI